MSDYRDEYRNAQRHVLWTLPRALGLGLVVIIAVFLLAVVTTPLTIAFGWYTGEANLRSFPHVAQTYTIAYDDARGMDANARQACRYKAEGLVDQFNAVADNYERLQGEYDAYMQDHFRGKLIHPADLPMPYPGLSARMAVLC